MTTKLLPKKISKIGITKFKVTYAGEFNFKELYKLMHEWLKDNYWQDIQTGSVGEMHEIMYHERVGPSGLKDIWIWWRLEKFPKNRYYKFTLDIDFLILAMGKTQVVSKGRKVKCDNGEVNIDINAQMHLDYKGEWSKNWMLRYFRNAFPERIFKQDIEKHWFEMYREAYDLQGTIKKYLHLKGFLTQMEVEPFFVSREYSIGGGE